MVISPTLKYAFVSTVKGGTNSLYQVLIEQFQGQRYGDFHCNDISQTERDWFLFTTCRNPYTRAVSVWYSTCMRGKDRYYFRQMCPNPDSFEVFAEWAYLMQSQLHRLSEAQQMLLMPQAVRHAGIPFHRILKLESLETEFARLPFVAGQTVKLPALNATQGQRDQAGMYLTERAIVAVQRWMDVDFQKYGYSRDANICHQIERAA